MQSETLVQMMQSSVSPVVLISGIGLLLLSMTNRLGRVVDRSRAMGRELRNAEAADQKKIRRQLRVLYRRAQLLRAAIVASSVSILLVAVIILVLFAHYLTNLPLTGLIAVLFVSCIGALVVSMVVFLQDLTLSLRALWMEISDQV